MDDIFCISGGICSEFLNVLKLNRHEQISTSFKSAQKADSFLRLQSSILKKRPLTVEEKYGFVHDCGTSLKFIYSTLHLTFSLSFTEKIEEAIYYTRNHKAKERERERVLSSRNIEYALTFPKEKYCYLISYHVELSLTAIRLRKGYVIQRSLVSTDQFQWQMRQKI